MRPRKEALRQKRDADIEAFAPHHLAASAAPLAPRERQHEDVGDRPGRTDMSPALGDILDPALLQAERTLDPNPGVLVQATPLRARSLAKECHGGRTRAPSPSCACAQVERLR